MERQSATLLVIFAILLALSAGVSRAYALSIATSPISFPVVNLNGNDQTIDGSTTPWRADATGESNGWHITVVANDFTNGSGKSIPVNNFEIRLLDSNISRVSGDTNVPASTQTTFSPLSVTPLKITSASIGEGDGVYDLTPDFQLTIPAETYAGNYAATITVLVSTGP